MKRFAHIGAIAAIAGLTSVASADVVINGGFETGDFTGWTVVDPSGATFVDNSPGFQHSGAFEAALGPYNGNVGAVSQVLALNLGDVVDIDFYMWQLGGNQNSMVVSLGGITLFSQVNRPGDAGYVHFSYTGVVVDMNNPTLTFASNNEPQYWLIDDVSVNVVPTPAAASLLGIGGLVAMRRRR